MKKDLAPLVPCQIFICFLKKRIFIFSKKEYKSNIILALFGMGAFFVPLPSYFRSCIICMNSLVPLARVWIFVYFIKEHCGMSSGIADLVTWPENAHIWKQVMQNTL